MGFRELLLDDNLLKRFSLFGTFFQGEQSQMRNLVIFCLISIIVHVLFGRCRGSAAM